ncbi:hypothetical protein [Christiangramia sp.]|uniref:hypothetical protein n=1 Tax=Christiangramia sp. TaxID=1931228 RepID=UPI00262FCF47|nr:hypothetical protein [Christiangramia sp.]
MKTRTLGVLGILLLAATSGICQDENYRNFDANSDGNLDRTEFDEMYNTGFSDWDSNRDEVINDKEFYDSTYRNLDRDQDNRLSQQEWDDGYERMYGDHLDTNKYNQFDADRDGYIDNDEYYEGFKNTDFYSSYDKDNDGNLTREELNSGVYNRMDEDQDGSINQREYQLYSSYYGTENPKMNRNDSGRN